MSPSPPDRAITPGQPRPASSPSKRADQAADPDPDELEEEDESRFSSIHSRKRVERVEERVGLVVRQRPLALEHDVQQDGDDGEDQQQQAPRGLRLERAPRTAP